MTVCCGIFPEAETAKYMHKYGHMETKELSKLISYLKTIFMVNI